MEKVICIALMTGANVIGKLTEKQEVEDAYVLSAVKMEGDAEYRFSPFFLYRKRQYIDPVVFERMLDKTIAVYEPSKEVCAAYRAFLKNTEEKRRVGWAARIEPKSVAAKDGKVVNMESLK